MGRSRVRRKGEVGGQELKSRRRVQTGWCSAGHWKDLEFFFFFPERDRVQLEGFEQKGEKIGLIF